MNHILTQKWFLFQNIKDSLDLIFVMVLSITDNGHTALLPVWPIFSEYFKNFKLKHVYATKNISMHSEHLRTYVEKLNAFFGLNSKYLFIAHQFGVAKFVSLAPYNWKDGPQILFDYFVTTFKDYRSDKDIEKYKICD
jgi:hypothetical protein